MTTDVPDTTTTTALGTLSADDLPDELGAFCDASAKYYVTVGALIEDVQTSGALEVLLPVAIDLVDDAIDAAPSEALAAEPIAARGALWAIEPVFEAADFDIGAAGVAAADVLDEFETLNDTYVALESFLRDECGSDVGELTAMSASLAAELDAEFGEEADAGDDVDVAADATAVFDDSGQLAARVPSAWVEVNGEPDGDFRQLIASTSITGLESSFIVPGMILLSADAPDGDADVAWMGGLAGAVQNSEQAGCVTISTEQYDDGVYVGEERVLDCPGGGGTVVFHAIGGSNAENDVWFVLLLVAELGSGVRELVGDSFLVD
ncbi:MAG: hypothetical protein AAFP84_00275 [Actinomycetota bacterium]